MADVKDMELVSEFARANSEAAFAELVARHINLVYSVAMRFTRNPTDAQDVTQAVFVILARRAAKLSSKTILTGWLYETTRFTSMKLLRTKARQQAREREAYMQSILNGDASSSDAWRQLEPLLEEAMARLSTPERTLLALRFYENKSNAEASAVLGIQEWTTRKRTSRAVEKLRNFFAKRGIFLSAAVLTAAISANSVQAAPVLLGTMTTPVAVTMGAAASASTLTLIQGALNQLAWKKAKTALAAGALALLLAGTAAIGLGLHHADDPGIAFEAEGTLDYETYHTHDLYSQTKHFIIMRQGDLWKIRTTNMMEERDGVETAGGGQYEAYSEMGYDGTNIYNFRMGNEKALGLFPPATVRSGNYVLATGRVFKSDAPPYLDTELQYPIWLAYCSGPYFQNLSGDEAVPPTFGERDFYNERPVPVKARVKWMMGGKYFVKAVSWYSDGTFKGYLAGGKTVTEKYQPPYDKPFVDRQFDVLAWTNWNGISVPSDFRITVSYPVYPTNGPANLTRTYTFKGRLENIRPLENFSPIPELVVKTGISDFRGPARRGNDRSSYISSNRWDYSDAIHVGAAGGSP